MLALWSRAAQTRSSCRCSACLHGASGIARRTTTAASKRRLKVGDLFTACYGTILGTAAFVDAKAKEERRKQWDQAIADAKAEIPIGDAERMARLPNQDQVQHHHSLLQPITSYQELSRHKTQLDDFQTILDLHLKQAFESSQKAPVPELPQSPELEEDWVDEAEAVDPNFSARDPVTRLHVDKMEGSVSRLVTRLLVRSRAILSGATSTVPSLEIFRQMKEISIQLELLRGVDTRLPSYTFHDMDAARKERGLLNDSLEALFKQAAADRSNFNVIVAKICYNLLVSSSPPSIQTYDILIRSLTQLRLHDLAQIVVDSFLLESKFSPTSTTVRLILDHHSAQKDESGFRAIVNRMRAVDGDMRIKKRSVESLHKPKEQEWALTRKVVRKGNHLREKVSRDADIFDSLINGFLQLNKLRAAVRYLRAALREGVQLGSDTLCRVVMACVKVVDYRAGCLVLRALLGQWEEESSSTVIYSGQARFAIRRLFILCGIELSLKPTSPLPHHISPVALLNLQRHIAITSMDEKLQNFATRTASIEAMVSAAANTYDVLRVQHLDKAISVLDSASKIERLKSRRNKKYSLEEAALQEEAILRGAGVVNMKNFLAAQYEGLSPKWKRQYDIVIKYNPRLGLADSLEIISFYQRGRHIPQRHRLLENVCFARKMESKSRRTSSTLVVEATEVHFPTEKKSPMPRSPVSESLRRNSMSQIPHSSVASPPSSHTLTLGLPFSSIYKPGAEAAAG